MLADARGEAREVAVGGHEAETRETAAVQQVHRVDHQRDVRPVRTDGQREVLLGNDRVIGQDLRPTLEPLLGEVAVYAAHARLPEGRDLLEEPLGDAGRDVLGVDEDGEARQRVDA